MDGDRSAAVVAHRITLTSHAAAADALAGLPDGTEAWIKDSYATLDLAGDDFTPVVQACWIHHPPSTPVSTGGWSLVRSPDGLAEWATASGTAGVVTAPLSADPGVRFVRVLDRGCVVAGAALSCATDVVGVSNAFPDGPTPEDTWDLVTAAATDVFPGRDLVGYEHGDDLEVARGAGFSAVGALRIWQRPVRSPDLHTSWV